MRVAGRYHSHMHVDGVAEDLMQVIGRESAADAAPNDRDLSFGWPLAAAGVRAGSCRSSDPGSKQECR